MKKLIFLFLALILMIGCKKDEIIKPPPPPPPIEKHLKITGNFDLTPFQGDYCYVVAVSLAIVYGRHDFWLDSSYQIYSNYSVTTGSFSITLDTTYNYLKGQSKELFCFVKYVDHNTVYSAILIIPITFGDEVNLGNIGYSNYTWIDNPRLRTVITATGQKEYYPLEK